MTALLALDGLWLNAVADPTDSGDQLQDPELPAVGASCHHAPSALGASTGAAMAKTSYLIYTIRATSKGGGGDDLTLDSLGGAGDLLHGLHGGASRLKKAAKPHLNARFEQAFDMLEIAPAGRSLWLRADAGAYGLDGNTTNIDTRTRTRRGKRDASMTEKRAMFVVPRGSRVAFLLCERRGSAHLKNHLEETILKSCHALFGINTEVSAFVDLPAWDNFLDNSEGVAVKSVWRPRILEQQLAGSVLENEGELQTVVTGGVAARVYRRLKVDLRRAMAEGAENPDAIEIATPTELLPNDANDFERQQLVLTAALDREKRTVLVERGAPPQFYYPLGDRPDDRTLRETWVSEAERVARVYGASLPAGWDAGTWTREQLLVGTQRRS